MSKVVNINHIGIVVHNIEKSLQFWQNILGIELDYSENVPSMNLDLAWLPVKTTRIELLEPTSAQNNEYADFLHEKGPGMHHICLCHGLRSFFSASAAPPRGYTIQRNPIPPPCPPAVVMSSGHVPLVLRYKRLQSRGRTAVHPVSVCRWVK